MNQNLSKSQRALSDKDRLLLMSFHDGECGVLGCWRAKRLISHSPEAVCFIGALSDFSRDFKTTVDTTTPLLEGSLWAAISNRIEQEERAALYLGTRTVRREESSRFSRFAPLGWSVAGGLVAASFTVFVAGNLNSPELNPVGAFNRSVASASLEEVAKMPGTQVNLVSQNDDLPRILESGGSRIADASTLSLASQSLGRDVTRRKSPQNNVDVDWVRSDGAVRFFSDPAEHSTMIWVKKRAPFVHFYSSPVKVVTPNTAEFSTEVPRFIEKPLSQPLAVDNRLSVGNGSVGNRSVGNSLTPGNR